MVLVVKNTITNNHIERGVSPGLCDQHELYVAYPMYCSNCIIICYATVIILL